MAQTSTVREALDVERSRITRGVVWRRIFVVALAVFVLAAATGWLGTRSRTIAASSGNLAATLTYGQIVRRGVSTPFRVVVRADKGQFTDDIVATVTQSYVDALDVNQISPQPSDESSSAAITRWSFSKPSTPTFSVSLDASVAPAVLPGRHRGVLTVASGGDDIRIPFTTWVVP